MYPRQGLICASILLTLASGYASAASLQELGRDHSTLQRIRNTSTLSEAFNLSQDEALILSKTRVDQRGLSHTRYRQTYHGVPVWGQEIIINRDSSGTAINLHGRLIRNLVIPNFVTPPRLSASTALEAMKNKVQSSHSNSTALTFRNESSQLVIYLDGDRPILSYAVSFFADTPGGGNPTRPTFLVDAHNATILLEYEGLTYDKVGTGPGGNVKTDLLATYYYGINSDYGINFNMFDVEVNDIDSSCTMTNAKVRTIDLNHGTGPVEPDSFSFWCDENSHTNTYKPINGAHSPLNDAHYFGGIVFDMYNQWGLGSPLENMPLTMRVHYSNNYENAFWDGSAMTFGDGDTIFYPLVSLDVTAHEVSHGFTEQYSKLIYSGQSGGINESFSDIAGEAAEFFMKGSADFMVGFDIIKATDGALRYLADPTLDGASIDHASDYYNGLDVHYSSGVFNRAFYILAAPYENNEENKDNKGWGIEKAFLLFAQANKVHWTTSATFDTAYVGLLAAAGTLGYDEADLTDIRSAFETVGVPKPPPGAVCDDTEPSPPPYLSNGVSTDNFSANAGQWNCWRVNPASGGTALDVVLRSTVKGRYKNPGDADLYIKQGSSPLVDPSIPLGEWDCGSFSSNSDERCTISSPAAGDWYIAVYAYSSFTSVSLNTTFDDGSPEPIPSGDITLTATVKGGRNKKFVALNWTGTAASMVDIYRGTAGEPMDKIASAIDNSGSYKDNDGRSDDNYQLCDAGGIANCSAPVTAN